ncbi:MAG: sugar phosphate isomerase/epimerase [Verrucomicrobia bacterium]|nr:sugar phosphate isomerase/epimerase [Verrucomicrobiota bacterium]
MPRRSCGRFGGNPLPEPGLHKKSFLPSPSVTFPPLDQKFKPQARAGFRLSSGKPLLHRPRPAFWEYPPVSPLALSTCWHAERVTEGGQLLQEAVRLGFSSVELSHNTRYSLWPGILSARSNQDGPAIKVLHNFCPVPVEVLRPHPNAYEFSDPREPARRLAERHTLSTLEAAAQVGATLVVLHIGSAGPRRRTEELETMALAGGIGSRPYVRKKIDSIREMERAFEKTWPLVEAILLRVGEKASSLGIRLGLECRESMREIPPDDFWDRILQRLPAPTFGYWHDFGHAAAKDWLGLIDHAQHLRRLAPRLIGAHLHDYHPERGDHLPPGQGVIPFARLLPLLPREAHVSLELSPDVSAEDVRASLTWWNQNQPPRS